MKFIARVNGKACKLQMTFKREVLREVNGTIIKEPTQYIQFDSDGYFETKEQDKIDFIKKHSMYGLNIHPIEEDIIQPPTVTETITAPVVKRGRKKKVE